ncbi:hypothetical protein SALBM135S_10172 [Streptomyces alboniger]
MTFLPWLSRVAYTPAISSGLAPMEPRVCAGTAGRPLTFMPSLPAISMTWGIPTSTPICAKTELTDLFIAFWTVTGP